MSQKRNVNKATTSNILAACDQPEDSESNSTTVPNNSMIEKWSKWLKITESSVIKKSNELHRLLELQSNANIHANNQCIICLDLAAEMLGSSFDTPDAVFRSNLTKKEYSRQKRNVRKLLGLNKVISIYQQLNVNKQVQGEAERLLDQYSQHSLYDQTDFSHPQYVCMAVYLSCQRQKVKFSKSEILAKSTLKASQWTQLEKEWRRWLDNYVATHTDDPVIAITAAEVSIVQGQAVRKVEIAESYEAWRDRILNKAYAEFASQVVGKINLQ